MLADPELTLEKVADSRRHLAALAAEAVRPGRPELLHLPAPAPPGALPARPDQPDVRQLSISEICFRWGFNGSAHFSRAFKDRYGVSPRDYRKGQAAAD